ncbi:MAG: serine/threonine protein kinase [Rhodospirillaceae bacterium]|nr:serine/threonine protein kinase [Rhodospirillales bacterium]
MERIGKYVIHKAAVTTGYARVFFCHDPDLQVPVAVKAFTVKPGESGPLSPAQWLARFQAEARALAAFDHPHIVAVKTMDVVDGQPFFVMPYQGAHLAFEMGKDAASEGGPADDQPRRLPLARALTLLRQLSAALVAMHRRGMVHRAVKPSNILLTSRDGGQIKLADFSMVKLPERNPPLPDHWLGATEYCAPEQRENASAVGPEADVYSLGVLAYRMLTGTLPDLSQGAVHLPAGLPAALAALVAQSTDPDPTRRPAHAGAFLQALGAVVVDLPAKPKVQVVSLRKPLRVVAAVAD